MYTIDDDMHASIDKNMRAAHKFIKQLLTHIPNVPYPYISLLFNTSIDVWFAAKRWRLLINFDTSAIKLYGAEFVNGNPINEINEYNLDSIVNFIKTAMRNEAATYD